MDYFVLDLQEKKIYTFDRFIEDGFVDSINAVGPIAKIKVINDGEFRIIEITSENNKKCQIKIDRANRIVSYINNDVEEIKDNFLHLSSALTSIELNNVKKIGNNFLPYCYQVMSISIPNVIEIGDSFLKSDFNIESLSFPKLKKVGNFFLMFNMALNSFVAPNLREVGQRFLASNNNITSFNLRVISIEYSDINLDDNGSNKGNYMDDLREILFRGRGK